MVSGDSLDSQVSTVVNRYSSLFTLPSQRTIFIYLFALCLIGGSIMSISRDFSLSNLLLGLPVGVFLFSTTLFADYLNSRVLVKSDPILDLRRCSFLSIPSSLILYFSLSSANLVGIPSVNLWMKIASAAFFTALTFRLFVFSMVSSVNYRRIFCSALVQPALLLVISSILPMTEYGFSLYFILPFLISTLLAVLGIRVFVTSVDAVGEKTLGIRSLHLFRAFLANWTENLNGPLEDFFEKLGEERDVRVSLLAFKTRKGLKAVMIVPVVHPGPFKNVGSSPLPHMIQARLEDRLGCVVSVPHGISGHDLDLASQFQNERILSRIAEFAESRVSYSYATPFARSRTDGASASCQIFGDSALFTLTLAPETMEDLPRELDHAIAGEVAKRGLAGAIIIDAHNSIEGSFSPDTVIEPLRKAATNALLEALGSGRHLLEVGAAKVNPKEFNLMDGMGPGGISVIVIKVEGQITAYITIDGNNLISGLREEILFKLAGLGITEGEILTTDTHVVNGVAKVDRGYHPVGEAMDKEKLLHYIEKATSEALRNHESAELSWRAINVPNVKIIGEKQLNDLCLLTEMTMKRVKKVGVYLFPALAALLAVTLIFL